MRLQELFETTEEDRALISLSSAVYDRVKPYIGTDDDSLISLGKIGDMVDTPLQAVNDVSVELLGGDAFIERAKDPDEDAAMYEGKELLAFYEEDTRTVVLNSDFLDRQRMKTSITHELRHALDEIKSGSYPGNAKRYFTPKKKEHRKDDPYSTTQYRAQPAEINARFVEVLDILSKRIPKWYDSNQLDAKDIKKKLSSDFNNLLVKFEIADLFPERTQSKDYKRLVKRAYDFMQKEINHIESQPDIIKRATGNW